MTRFVVLLLLSCATASLFNPEVEEKCGYESCHPVKEGYVNVHIVPHTHDDVGWLKTVDQYFYGSKTKIQDAGVQYILDSVLASLKHDRNRRFIYVETAYLFKWWMQQHDTVKSQFRKLIRNGQLEIIGGAWSMNDEATTHYQSIIDQFTWGLRRLNDTFGYCGRPKVAWQIDPFGHSREMASIVSQLGFDGLFLGRIDYQDKENRFNRKTPEMIWQSSQNLGNSSNLFTGVLYNTYSPPPGFCFDVLCTDEPIIDDKRSPDYNAPQRWAKFNLYLHKQKTAYLTKNLLVTMGGDFTYMQAEMVHDFLNYVHNMTKRYATNNVLVTMGEDFTYQDANKWFKNLDKLIHYGNRLQANGSKYHLLYSTPSCYLKAVYDESHKKNIKYPVKTDDFFPYASDPHSYWTGYFTSKPTIKRFERLANNFLQVCKQLYALTDLGPEDWTDLNVMREAMGVMQHHDAVTGTEKEHVAHDYARILTKGFSECQFIAHVALGKIVKGKSDPDIPFESCLLRNISQCGFTEDNKKFIVTVYNPLSRPVNHYVRLPVADPGYKVTDNKGKELTVQVVPIPDPILNIPGRFSKANQEIIFLAEDLPPLGFRSFYVEQFKGTQQKQEDAKELQSSQVRINEETGLISEIYMNGRKIPLQQNFFFYPGAVGNNEISKNRSSGAYIFRPNGTTAFTVTNKVTNQIYKGKLVTEIHQKFNEWVSQIIRIYSTESFIEFDWLIGPIPRETTNGIEVITKYMTKLKSDGTFYTDSNGREMMKRVKNFRPSWNLNVSEEVAGNYYPVTSKILIRDSEADIEVAVLNDRAQGGTSLNNGEIELMLHRNCLKDDAFGVGEPLDEMAFNKRLVVRGSHYLVAGPYINNNGGKTLAAQERDLAQRKLLQAWTFLSPTNGLDYKNYKQKYKMEYSGLKRALPDNVQILTLEPWMGFKNLLRFEHVLEKHEDPVLSKPVTIDLRGLFSSFEITSYRETTLGANQWLSENKKLMFNSSSEQELVYHYQAARNKIDNDVEHLMNDARWVEGARRWLRNQDESNDVNVKQYMTVDSGDSNESSLTENFVITLNPMQIRTFIVDVKIFSEK